MTRSRKSRLTVLVIIAAMLVTMMTCVAQVSAKAENAPADYFTPYEEPLEITFVRSTSPSMEDRISKLNAEWGDEGFENNRWTKLYKERLNIDVKYLWIVDSAQYDAKFKMAMASGDLPDIFGAQVIDLYQLNDAGMVADMTELWNTQASPLTKSVITAEGQDALNAMTIGGKLMGIPSTGPSLDSMIYLWMRVDWLAKLGLTPPKTVDEFMKVAEAFVTQDPDGNGVNDTYAFMLDKYLWDELEGIAWMFGARPDTWIEKDGGLEFGIIQPEMKDFLKMVAQMYKDKWIDNEFIVKDYPKAIESVAQSKIGLVPGYHWWTWDFEASRKDNPDAQWAVYDWPSITGEQMKYELELGASSALAVKSDFAHPEALIKMLNLYMEVQFGETADYDTYGIDKKTGVDGVWLMGPIACNHPYINLLPYHDILKVAKGELKPEELNSLSKNYYDMNAEYWPCERCWGTGTDTVGYFQDRHIAAGNFFIDMYSTIPTPTKIERWGQLKEFVNATVTQMITGEVDVETGFDKFVADWKAQGGDAITAEINEIYKANQAAK